MKWGITLFKKYVERIAYLKFEKSGDLFPKIILRDKQLLSPSAIEGRTVGSEGAAAAPAKVHP